MVTLIKNNSDIAPFFCKERVFQQIAFFFKEMKKEKSDAEKENTRKEKKTFPPPKGPEGP